MLRSNYMTPIRFLSTALVALSLAAVDAHAQEPAATPEAAAAPAAPATPAAPEATPAATKAAKPAKTPSAAVQATPVATATAGAAARTAERLAKAKSVVEGLRAGVDLQIADAKRVYERSRDEMALNKQDEIQRALERGIDHVGLQMARVETALVAAQRANDGKLDNLVEETLALETLADDAADTIANVLTHDGRTESALQRVASKIREIEDRADEAADELDAADDADAQENAIELHLESDDRGGVRIRSSGSDRVSFGNGIEVKIGETVRDAVAFGAPVKVSGSVLGSAISFGDNVHVSSTGHVKGDAASFGGRIIVDDGGTIDGQQMSFGPAAALSMLSFGSLSVHRPEVPLPQRIGGTMLKAGAQFLVLFLLGLLVLAIAPQRATAVADALEAHPFKAGGFGVLAMIAAVPFSLVLFVTVIGIPLIPVLWVGLFASWFFGLIALAMLVGRRLPTKVIPTNTAVLALGAAVLVAVGLLPWAIGWIAWFFIGFFAVGAVLMTKFGAPTNGGSSMSAPQDLTATG